MKPMIVGTGRFPALQPACWKGSTLIETLPNPIPSNGSEVLSVVINELFPVCVLKLTSSANQWTSMPSKRYRSATKYSDPASTTGPRSGFRSGEGES